MPMTLYDPDDDESLWPDEGYGVIAMDEIKHPSNDDFMVMIGQFDDPDDLVIPGEKTGYTYYVHGADGDSWTREEWRQFVSD